MKLQRVLLMGGSGIGLAILCATAHAQAGGSSAEEQVNAENQAIVLEEVIVTARKREESLQDVPISVSVISSEQLAAQNIQRVMDLTNKLPNFLMVTGGVTGLTNVAVRGVEVNVRNAGFNPSVSFYVDGVYQGRPLNFNQDLVDVQRVELLLGPQGTLFGQNTIAGVVNIVTRRPQKDFDAFAEVKYGKYDYRDVRGSINMPIVSERFYARLSGAVTERDGYQRNLFTAKAHGNVDRKNARVQLLGDFDRTQILLTGDYQRADERAATGEYVEYVQVTTAGIPNDFLIAPRPLEISQNPSTTDVARDGVALNIDHAFGGGGTLSSITAWKESSADDVFDQDFQSDPRIRADVYNNESQKLFSQEFRFESSQERRARYTLGASYLKDEVKQDRAFDFPAPFVLLGGLGAQHFQVPAFSSLESDSLAAYGNVDFDISKSITLGAGLRYSQADQATRYRQAELLIAQGGVPSTALARSVFGPSRTGFLIANPPDYTDKREDDSVSGTFTATYRFDDERQVYARLARGTKAGGFNLEPLPDVVPANREFGPEELDSYELGLKSQWFGRRLVVNAAAFLQRYRDLQRADVIPLQPAGQTRVVRNAGEVEVSGGELVFAAVLAKGLELRGSFGYAGAEFVEFTTLSGQDLSGQKLSGIPAWNASAGISYARPLTGNLAWFVDVSADIRDRRLLGEADSTAVSVNGYTVADARIGVRGPGGRWEASLWGTNIFDELYVTARSNGNGFYPNADAVTFGPPAMFGATVRYQFGSP